MIDGVNYAKSKVGVPVSLGELAQISGMDKTIISRNNGFLVQVKIISDGSRKAPTEVCVDLGRAYELGIEERIIFIWNEVVNNDEFLSRMISTIQIRGEMAKQDFINHIIFSSSNSNTNNTRAGASAIVEILKLTQLIQEKDGKITAGNGNLKVGNVGQIEIEKKEKDRNIDGNIKKNEVQNKENSLSEPGYYIQSYTCESGKAAKFIIPEDATEDDLLAFEDMLNIVLKRKFKIKNID